MGTSMFMLRMPMAFMATCACAGRCSGNAYESPCLDRVGLLLRLDRVGLLLRRPCWCAFSSYQFARRWILNLRTVTHQKFSGALYADGQLNKRAAAKIFKVER